jgi:hypothetical protein
VTKQLTAENRLLLCCARTRFDDAAEQSIKDLLGHDLDWSYVMDTAGRHAILPLLYRGLRAVEPNIAPPDVVSSLRTHFLHGAARNLVRERELTRILALFDDHALPAIPLKGPVLAAQLYEDVSLRPFDDLDILIRKDDLAKAKELLAAIGFEALSSLAPHQESVLLDCQQHVSMMAPSTGTLVELHWTLEPGATWTHFSQVTVWKRLEAFSMSGLTARTLSQEDQLLYLCVHGASHCWNRAIWICDVAECLHRFREIDWQALLDQARRLRRTRMLMLGLMLAYDLLNAPIPEAIRKVAQADSLVVRLAGFVRDHLFDQGDSKESLRREFFFRLRARESLKDQLRFFLQRFFVPDAIDVQTAALPRSFRFFYFVLRPLRLALKHVRMPIRLSRRVRRGASN